jgi:hypothetical protein
MGRIIFYVLNAFFLITYCSIIFMLTLTILKTQAGKLLLVLASAVILGSESHGTRDNILLSHGSGSRDISFFFLLLNDIYKSSPYLTGNTLLLRYKA